MKVAILSTTLLVLSVSGAFASPHCNGDFKSSGTAQCFVIR